MTRNSPSDQSRSSGSSIQSSSESESSTIELERNIGALIAELSSSLDETNPVDQSKTEQHPSIIDMTTMSSTKEIIVGGVKIKVTEKPQQSHRTCQYPKGDRSSLDAKELLALKKEIVAPLPDKFESISTDVKDPKKLQEHYDLSIRVEEARRDFETYDMLDVFNLLSPVTVHAVDDVATGIQKGDVSLDLQAETLNLFKDYSTITVDQVTASTRWYATYPTPDQEFRNNLAWSAAVLRNSTSPDLRQRIDRYVEGHAKADQGGPLYFWYLMQSFFLEFFDVFSLTALYDPDR